jgi:hypothetical protein
MCLGKLAQLLALFAFRLTWALSGISTTRAGTPCPILGRKATIGGGVCSPHGLTGLSRFDLQSRRRLINNSY